MIFKQQITVEELNQSFPPTLVQHLGISVTEIGEDYIIAKMPVDHRTHQPAGLLHGGASAALAETVGSIASHLCLENPKTHQVVGVEINANHLRGVSEGFVYGKASAVRIGKLIHVWNIEITSDSGKLICVSRLTISVIMRISVLS